MEGLRGSFAAQYPAWNSSLTPLFAQIRDFPLKVLLFGPGARPDTIDKREQIAKHLVLQNLANEPLTSEQLIALDPNSQLVHPYDAEFLHVREADVILVVVTHRATGSQAEIATFWHNPYFTQKAYLISPKLSARKRRALEASSSYLAQGWLGYPLDKQFQYTDAEFADCNKIRDFCNAIVERIRQQRGFEQIRANGQP